MIHGITSLGQGRSQLHIRAGAWMLHVLGGASGGAAIGGSAWLLLTPFRTLLPNGTVPLVVALIAGAAIALELRPGTLPNNRSQVPVRWLRRFGPLRSYLLYGGVLGIGVATHVPYTATYVVIGGLALTLSLSQALVAGALFGAARSALVGPMSLLASRVSLTNAIASTRGMGLGLSALVSLVVLVGALFEHGT